LACNNNWNKILPTGREESTAREVQVGKTDYYMFIPYTDKIVGGWGEDGQQYQISHIDTTIKKGLVFLNFVRRYPEGKDPYLKNIKRIETSKFFISDAKWKVYQFDTTIEFITSYNIDETYQAVAIINSKSEQEAAIYLSMFATLHKKTER